MSNHDFQPLKGPFNDFNRLADFDGTIESHDLFRTDSRLERSYNIFRQGCQPIAKMENPSNSMRTFYGAMLLRIDKFCEQIAGKHCLYEPNRPPLGHPSESQPRRETVDAKMTPEGGRGQMLALWLRL